MGKTSSSPKSRDSVVDEVEAAPLPSAAAAATAAAAAAAEEMAGGGGGMPSEAASSAALLLAVLRKLLQAVWYGSVSGLLSANSCAVTNTSRAGSVRPWSEALQGVGGIQGDIVCQRQRQRHARNTSGHSRLALPRPDAHSDSQWQLDVA